MGSSAGRLPAFAVVVAACRRTAALDRRQFGHQREQVIVAGQCRDATVVYATDLGRALSIAVTLRGEGDGFVLLDLHAVMAESVDHLRELCGTGANHAPRNRLVFCGTQAGLRSYLADIASMGIVDGVVLSVVESSAPTGEPARLCST
ncbi:hypothetical protein [Mycolicibacterium mengxianglii]|uniref:hypothetical protein n=1 Tax=Mycolicibacterium mengxianglii TaxID=2736649 RepID=UPI0018D0608D|nr:hypothetical protein [Mycolicibacterium mengxianglii]